MLIPATIDATGQTDVTAKWNAWLKSLPAGAVAESPAKARYRIDGTLLVDREISVTGGEFFHPLSTGNRTRAMWRVTGPGQHVFDGLSIVGANPHAGTSDAAYDVTREAQHGFDVQGASATIRNTRIRNVYGDFLYAGLDPKLKWCDTITVEDVDWSGTGRQGISPVAVRNMVVRRFNLSNVRRSMIDLEPSSKDCGASNVWFVNGTFGSHRLNMLSSGGNNGGNVDTVVLANIRMTSPMTVQIPDTPLRGSRSNFYFINLKSTSPPYGSARGFGCIDLHRVEGVTVERNVQPLQKGEFAKFTGCAFVTYDGKH